MHFLVLLTVHFSVSALPCLKKNALMHMLCWSEIKLRSPLFDQWALNLFFSTSLYHLLLGTSNIMPTHEWTITFNKPLVWSKRASMTSFPCKNSNKDVFGCPGIANACINSSIEVAYLHTGQQYAWAQVFRLLLLYLCGDQSNLPPEHLRQVFHSIIR